MRRTCTFAAAVGLLAAVAYGQVASTAPTTEPPVLSYRFVEGRKHVYEVQLVACVAGDRTTRDGLIEFSVTSVRNGQVSMQFTNLPLGVSTRAGSQEIVRDYRRAGSPSRIPLPRFGPSANRPETSQPPAALLPRHAAWTPPKPAIAVFSQNGELLSGATIARMPLLLGYQDQFVIAPLPRQAAAAWTSGADVTLILDERGTTCPAKEESRYTIVASKPPLVHLAKSYQSARSAADDKGVSLVTMHGLGNLEFDTQAGMFRSLAMTYVLELARAATCSASPSACRIGSSTIRRWLPKSRKSRKPPKPSGRQATWPRRRQERCGSWQKRGTPSRSRRKSARRPCGT